MVGPNGCGKSNLIDALRWVMGETSARGLRGGEMDDVIFAGTAARPAFDLAEVSLRSEGQMAVNDIAAKFRGGGHLRCVRHGCQLRLLR